MNGSFLDGIADYADALGESGTPSAPVAAERPVILVVDDTPENLQLVELILAREGYEVRSASSGKRALAAVEQSLPQLILLDINMPLMDGFEVCRRLKAEPRSRDVPVIFISALRETEEKIQAFSLGAVDYIPKPFHAEELLARVATHLRLHSLQRSLFEANQSLRTTLEHQRAILGSAGEGIIGLDEECRVTFINPAALVQFGYEREDLEGIDFHQLVHHTSPDGASKPKEECPILCTLRRGGTLFVGDDQFFRKGGTPFPVEYTVTGAGAAYGRSLGIVVFRDITERRRLELELREAAAVFDVSTDGIVVTDAQTVIRRVNPGFTEITGYTADEVIGKTPHVLKSGHHSAEFYGEMWRALDTQGHWEGEIWNRRKDGSLYPEWQMITTIRGEKGEVVGYVAQFSDITRRKLTEEEIRQRGNYDALTGLVNRSLLFERLEQAVREHRRKELGLALLFIDLDGFKEVNDTMGHARGDLLLKEAARRIEGAVRDTDTAARLGGDEFVILVGDLEDQKPAERIASRLIESLAAPFDLNGRQARIGASIGLAVYPNDGADAETLLRNADFAMYRAKQDGRGQLQFFTEEMEREFLHRARLAADLRLALEREEFTVQYQPIVDLRDGRPRGVEALVRWRHPEMGMVSPANFIPIAEEIGLILAIGRWVFQSVCWQLATWQYQGLDLYASINVSARQIPHGLAPRWMADLVREAGLKPQQLVIEVTESIFAKEVGSVASWLEEVRALGFRVYLDDFGTGYSSLSYLRNFPVDAVKIDRSFVSGMVEQERGQALVRAIVAMSEGLGLDVVAEGIEGAGQWDILRGLNCPFGQGYLFSKPVSAQELQNWWPDRREGSSRPGESASEQESGEVNSAVWSRRA